MGCLFGDSIEKACLQLAAGFYLAERTGFVPSSARVTEGNNPRVRKPFSIEIACHCGRLFFAERTGFEPVIPFGGIHAFQACLFNHSSISPKEV